MKVGVLSYKGGQTHESDMFSNKNGSPEFNQFLNFIGSHIQLSGFDGYSGDLDVSDKHLDGHSHNRQIIRDSLGMIMQLSCSNILDQNIINVMRSSELVN
ncbi:MAG: hypothetical protein EZS28_027398 [Streblomastix strix]|uniref:Rap-GAP domain-containing protein n=1 Tax=Streblomastix strix TaxID=222440 RepID=A0A5J4V2A2_9EUKA|nr:MAG: hypothetical protein EZS28_027398 [Streblomastix strix]